MKYFPIFSKSEVREINKILRNKSSSDLMAKTSVIGRSQAGSGRAQLSRVGPGQNVSGRAGLSRTWNIQTKLNIFVIHNIYTIITKQDNCCFGNSNLSWRKLLNADSLRITWKKWNRPRMSTDACKERQTKEEKYPFKSGTTHSLLMQLTWKYKSLY